MVVDIICIEMKGKPITNRIGQNPKEGNNPMRIQFIQRQFKTLPERDCDYHRQRAGNITTGLQENCILTKTLAGQQIGTVYNKISAKKENNVRKILFNSFQNNTSEKNKPLKIYMCYYIISIIDFQLWFADSGSQYMQNR